MRWLFLLVVLLNGLYLLTQLGSSETSLYEDIPRLRNVEPIILVREIGNITKTPVAESGQCLALGPFSQKDSLQALKNEIVPYVVNAIIRDRKGQDYTVHWVYIQPEKSRKDIIKVAKRLKIKKIKDFYIIREGEKNNGISLGHFKNKKRALGLEVKVKKQGFDVHIEPIHRTSEVFWLEYELIDQALPKEIVNKYTQTAGSVISRLSRDCNR